MTALLLEPHNDDCALFASFTALRFRPHVVTVLRSVVQEGNGIGAHEREIESAAAMGILGCSWEQWNHPDNDPMLHDIRSSLERIDATQKPEVVFAPWSEEPGGHDQHWAVGKLAAWVFGDRVRFYCTYKVGGDKTRGREVPYEPSWIEKKHRALACYRSQMERGPRRLFMMDLHEYEPDV